MRIPPGLYFSEPEPATAEKVVEMHDAHTHACFIGYDQRCYLVRFHHLERIKGKLVVADLFGIQGHNVRGAQTFKVVSAVKEHPSEIPVGDNSIDMGRCPLPIPMIDHVAFRGRCS